MFLVAQKQCTLNVAAFLVIAQMKDLCDNSFLIGVLYSSNGVRMSDLQPEQWRVNLSQLASEGHNFLLLNQIEAHEKSMEIY
jgi:hypothetical protein